MRHQTMFSLRVRSFRVRCLIFPSNSTANDNTDLPLDILIAPLRPNPTTSSPLALALVLLLAWGVTRNGREVDLRGRSWTPRWMSVRSWELNMLLVDDDDEEEEEDDEVLELIAEEVDVDDLLLLLLLLSLMC